MFERRTGRDWRLVVSRCHLRGVMIPIRRRPVATLGEDMEETRRNEPRRWTTEVPLDEKTLVALVRDAQRNREDDRRISIWKMMAVDPKTGGRTDGGCGGQREGGPVKKRRIEICKLVFLLSKKQRPLPPSLLNPFRPFAGLLIIFNFRHVSSPWHNRRWHYSWYGQSVGGVGWRRASEFFSSLSSSPSSCQFNP